MKHTDLSLAAHISFFFVEERIPNLRKVVEAILEYKQFSTKHIWIHSNKNFSLNLPNVHIVVHDCSLMMHPWHLTWAHRPLLKSQIGKYDVFMYNEDDILVTQNNIDYWFEYNPFAISLGKDLGFIRIETDNFENEFVVDLLHGEKHDGRWKYGNTDFAILRRNYRGFWLYNSHLMEYFSNTNGFCSMPNYTDQCRENAARGMQHEYYTKTIVPIIDGKLHMDSRVYHLSNNYWGDPNTRHAKVSFEDTI